MELPRLDQIIPTVAMETRASERRAYRHRVSNVGECPRALVYDRLGFEPRPHPGRTVLIFGDGNLHEDATVEWLAKTDYSVTDRQRAVDVGEIHGCDPFEFIHCDTCDTDVPLSTLHGHIDGLILVDGRHVLFEHKAIGEFSYKLIDKEFPQSYVKQCCCYIKGLKDQGVDIDSAIILLRSKDKATYKQIVIEYDHDSDRCTMRNEWNDNVGYMEDVVGSCLSLHSFVEECSSNGEIPDRPFDYDEWKCKLCRYRETCWDGYVAEFQARPLMTEAEVESVVETLAREQDLIAKEKTAVEKRLTEAKKKLKSELTRLGVKGGTFGSIKIRPVAFEKEDLDHDKIPEDVKKNATRKIPIVFLKVEEIDGVS